MLQLLAGQSHFAQGAGFQPSVPAGPVEQIIDDRQARLWIAGAGGPALIGDSLPTKGLPQFLAVRQTHQGTVQAHQSVSSPASDRMFRAIEGGQHAVAIQFAEGTVFELGPRMSHRSAGDRFKELALGQIIEKLVQMALDRLDGLLQEKKHQQRESQLALAGEILRSHSMARQEVLISQLSAQSFDQGDEVMRNVMNSSVHPHGNGGIAEHVQAKSFIISMLQLTCSPSLLRARKPPNCAIHSTACRTLGAVLGSVVCR